MSKANPSARLSRLALAGVAAVALAGPIGAAHADKVGVAAAVNPDAFSSLSGSPQTQLNIGKSIFFNERINTTGKGLVQVLLVDGSTFTVGPGSDLVIDKFVYDPNKKSGEVVASFSKGVMRFVGGKISKNEGGVMVNTPSGALAIRGGMFQTQWEGLFVPVRREHDSDRQERSDLHSLPARQLDRREWRCPNRQGDDAG